MQVQNSRGGPKAFHYKPLALTMKLADTESISDPDGELGPGTASPSDRSVVSQDFFHLRPADRKRPAGRFTVRLACAACGTTHEVDDPVAGLRKRVPPTLKFENESFFP